MTKMRWLGLAMAVILPLGSGYAQAPAPEVSTTPEQPSTGSASVPANISPAAAEVIRLAEAGTGEDVLLAFIQNSTSSFNLSADQILYLRDVGLSSQIITAMLNRDNVLRNQPQTFAYD